MAVSTQPRNVKDANQEKSGSASVFGIRSLEPRALLSMRFNSLFGTDEFKLASAAETPCVDAELGLANSRDSFATGGLAVATPNDAPDGQVDHFHVAYGATVVGNVLDSDFESSADSLTAALAVGPAKGTISLKDDGSFRYVPDDGFFGLDRFWYQIDDINGHTEQVEVCVFVDAPPNLVPDAEDDFHSTGYGESVTGDLIGNDFDPDGDDFVANLLEEPEHGQVSAKANGTFEYVPDEGFSGTDSFVYRIVDTDNRRAIAIVSIDVAGRSINEGSNTSVDQ